MGVKDTQRALLFIQEVTDVATKRIESGHDADTEIRSAQTFCLAGLATI
jgi:ATP-dependent 26S proteasome regulatory subunit